MSKPLRNIAALVDFDCAARWCSFKLAAHELHKTPAAVSQNIKQLEQQLGFALFERHARHLSMTEKGRELAVTVSRVLNDLQVKVAALQDEDSNDSLRISCTHSFAMKWLVPRLHRFTEKHPNIDIRVESSDTVVDMAQGLCDVAIRHQLYSEGDDASLLWREQLLLAYSPDLLDQKDRKASQPVLKRLLRYPLLYEGTPEDWIRLLQARSMLGQHTDFAQNYSHAGLLVQATVAAQGVAMLPYAIAYEDIRQGRLCIAPGMQLSSRYCYRLMRAAGRADTARVQHFINWLKEELAMMAALLKEKNSVADGA